MRQDGRASALESRVHSLEKNAGRSGAGAAVYPRKRPTNALGTEEFAVASLQTKERSLSRSVGRQEGGDVGSQLSPRVSSKFGPRKAVTTTTTMNSTPAARHSPTPLPGAGNVKNGKGTHQAHKPFLESRPNVALQEPVPHFLHHSPITPTFISSLALCYARQKHNGFAGCCFVHIGRNNLVVNFIV